MKRIRNFLFLTGCVMLAACGEDGITLPEITQPPSVDLQSGADLVSSDASIDAGTTFTVQVSASQGDAPLSDLRIQEDGVNVPVDRLTVDGAGASANPILLVGAEKTSFSSMITIQASSLATSSQYSFIVTDDDQETATTSVFITTISTPPSLAIIGSDTISRGAGELVQFNVEASPGTTELQSIAVYENGVLIEDASRLTFDATAFDSNPFALSGDDVNGFARPVFVRTSDTLVGTATISIEVIDAAEMIAADSSVILVGTAVNALMGVLFNAGGPVGRGGLDLDNGMGTGSSDPAAELRDEGINLDLPVGSNWRRQIAGANNAEVRYLIPGQGGLTESFDFNNISFNETIAALFDNGISFTATNADGDLVSDPINEGDVLVVRRDDMTYLVQIVTITETADNNDDSYMVDIKF